MAWQDISQRNSVIQAMRECDRMGRENFLRRYKYRRSRSYLLVDENGKEYDSKAILGVAHKYEFGNELDPYDFSGGNSTVKPKLESLGFTVFVGAPPNRDGQTDSASNLEKNSRLDLWRQIDGSENPKNVEPKTLRDMRIYGGASGVWVDKVRTGPISEDGSGVAVGLLHTGTSYSDDLSALGIIYHYPQTNRPTARDQAEIDATKNAARQGIPVFVIAYPSPNAATRDVFLAWVEGWDDVSKTFYIGFGESPPEQLIEDPLDSEPFEPIEKRNRKMGQVPQRPDQGRFRFRVLRRYGPKCMVCDVRVDQLLEAAHVVPDNRDGTYDPRNGLVFCRNHHRSFDLDLFAIGGIDYSIEFPDEGIDSRMLQITAQKLEPMKNKFPHNDALRTRYAGSSVNSKE